MLSLPLPPCSRQRENRGAKRGPMVPPYRGMTPISLASIDQVAFG